MLKIKSFKTQLKDENFLLRQENITLKSKMEDRPFYAKKLDASVEYKKAVTKHYKNPLKKQGPDEGFSRFTMGFVPTIISQKSNLFCNTSSGLSKIPVTQALKTKSDINA